MLIFNVSLQIHIEESFVVTEITADALPLVAVLDVRVEIHLAVEGGGALITVVSNTFVNVIKTEIYIYGTDRTILNHITIKVLLLFEITLLAQV